MQLGSALRGLSGQQRQLGTAQHTGPESFGARVILGWQSAGRGLNNMHSAARSGVFPSS